MEFKTKSERFVLSKRGQWQQLHAILTKLTNNGFHSLAEEEILIFPRLFRLTCADLAEAKMLQLSPDVIDYLNQLVGQAHKVLYSFPAVRFSQIRSFFAAELPSVILRNWIFVVLSAVIFFTSYLVTYHIVREDPDIARRIVPRTLLLQMEESYREEMIEERSLTGKNFAVSFYIQNNISIAFSSFALGILLGIGTIYILIFNGVYLGAISGYIIGIGYRTNFITFITAHSVAELTGLVVAGASGLVLGYSIIKATRYYRKEWILLQKQNIFSLVAASALLLLMAAFIEGMISPSLLPYRIKGGVAIASLILILGYFFVWPIVRTYKRRVRRS